MVSTNTFSVNFIIRYNKKNRSVALIYARIMVNGEIKEISLKETIKSADWDTARESVKGKSTQAKAINRYIEDVRFRLKEKYRMLEEKNYLVTASAVKEAYLGTM